MTDALLDGKVYRLDLGFVNAYLVDDGEVTLVDAGTPGAADSLRAELEAAGYAPADLDRVLVTHFDLDHVGGLARLGAEAPVHAMEPDASVVDGSATPPLSTQKGLLQRLMALRYTPPDRPVDRVADGEAVGGFTAHHAPGHTPGHTVYRHDTLPVALLGDCVREAGGRLKTPPWFLNNDTAENAASVRSLADRELAFAVAAMGHGEPLVEGGDEALRALARRLG
ncbi:MAG: MBL fold metallo-hydrolase [Halobacteriales archaeon]